MKSTRRVKLTLTIVTLIIIFLIYIFSYCFVLPIVESRGYRWYAYRFYFPVEYLRLKSDIIWRITEWGYVLLGGKVTPLNRRSQKDNYLLRLIVFRTNGKLLKEFISDNKCEIRKYYNSNGKLFAKYKIQKDDSVEIHEEGIKFIYLSQGNFFNSVEVIENGKVLWRIDRDKEGNIVAECKYKNNMPWTGSRIEIFYRKKRKTDKNNINCLVPVYSSPFTCLKVNYKAGKRINNESFDQQKLKIENESNIGKGWPEIKDFKFPFKLGPDIYVHKEDYYKMIKLLNKK